MLNKRIIPILYIAILMMLSELSIAAPPLPFSAFYNARFQGFKAVAEISLTQLNDSDYVAYTTIKIRLFGATVSTIRELSEFDWHDDAPRPHHYEYIQSGIGGRSRTADFDWQSNLAIATVRNQSVELKLDDGTLDELSMYTYLKQELNKGYNDIYFPLVRRNTIEEYHYRIVGEEDVATESGIFSAIKVERIRENSDRLTQLWFAKNHDMLLVKLFQRAPDGDEFEISLRSAQINGEIVLPD